ncbi:hypothetical protein Fmac_007890 [Flemingia macrophylla]|uniref:F-box domain-containing protein n=1 Tax=Flemingia macrophylla TaxID=520843 RepID=A0ABD1MY76_9FABA
MLGSTGKMPKLAPTGDESPSSAVLPEELIWEILLRVPVRSLVQFRCVCKSWNSLISDPQFAKDHLRTTATDPNQRLVSSLMGNPKIVSFSVQSLIQSLSSPARARRFSMSDKFHILGSCNGLLCLCDIHQRCIRLWNPSIRFRSKRFPTGVTPDTGITHHGFGYDHLTDSYKLLVAVEDLNEKVTKVYTFGENSWKVIQNFPCRPTRWLGKFVSGTLNWIAKAAASDDQWVILNFDLGNESYGEVLLPQEGDCNKFCNPVLNVLRGCLCVCFYDSKEARWVVWLMKEYGVQHSWTKLVMIPHFIQDPWIECQHSFFRWYHSLEPLAITENGIIILKTNFSKVVIYNSIDGKLNYLRIRGEHGLHDLHSYHESLVFPPC